MFTNVSMAGTGVIITVITTALKLFGIEVGDDMVTNAVEGGVAILGLVLLVWGQLRRDDLSGGLIRKA